MKNFKIFREIEIGGISKDQLIQTMIKKGIQFNKYAFILFEHSSFAPDDHIEKVRLVKVTLSDFGLHNPSSYQEFTRCALSHGLKLCPLYLAAFLRLDFLDQPEGPYLTIASLKPENDESHPNGFYIRNHERALWLRGYRANDFCEWPQDNEFIFLK